MQTNVQHQSGDQSLVTLIPRVNIHAFCDNQQTAEVMQSASADRRMSRSHVTIQLGGIMAAVQVYQGQATPNVLMVESHGSRDAILSELSQLAQVARRPPGRRHGHITDDLPS
jgi:pilus assembly protein CpaE